MNVPSPFKTRKILTVHGVKSNHACLMQVIVLVDGQGVVNQNVKKLGGGMMRLTVLSKRKDDSGKSGRKVGIKKKIFRRNGIQSQLSMLLEKLHKKPNLEILKATTNEIKSSKKLVE